MNLWLLPATAFIGLRGLGAVYYMCTKDDTPPKRFASFAVILLSSAAVVAMWYGAR